MRITKKIEKELFFDVVIFFISIALISFLYTNNILLTSILSVMLLLGIKGWYKSHDIYFLLSGAIIGPIGEIICIYFGTWTYANPTVLGIPIWLPIIWGLATMMIRRVAEVFVKMEKK